MNCCVIFCFKDGRENEAAIMKLYTIEPSMLKQNHKTLDPIIFVVSNFLGTEYIVEISFGNISVHVYFPVFDNELWEMYVPA